MELIRLAFQYFEEYKIDNKNKESRRPKRSISINNFKKKKYDLRVRHSVRRER